MRKETTKPASHNNANAKLFIGKFEGRKTLRNTCYGIITLSLRDFRPVLGGGGGGGGGVFTMHEGVCEQEAKSRVRWAVDRLEGTQHS